MKSLALVKEKLAFDIAIVGGGLAGLSTGIRLKQLDPNLEICVIEKSRFIGGHVLSGGLFNPRALFELLPRWEELGSPISVKVTKTEVLYLNRKSSFRVQKFAPWASFDGNFICSLGEVCVWLSKIAESMGIRVFESFTAKELVWSDLGAVQGVTTGEVGVNFDQTKSEKYQAGFEVLAKQTVLAEGTKGKLTEQLIHKNKLLGYHDIQYKSEEQTYSLGFKETWTNRENPPGQVLYFFGHPGHRTKGLVCVEDSRVHVSMISGLDYVNPSTDLFQEFQLFKSHPEVKKYLTGECLEFGSKLLDDGGFFSVPKLSAPGALIVGAAGGLTNPVSSQGGHYSMKSGILAAEAISESLSSGVESKDLTAYYKKYLNSWIFEDLFRVRNMRQSFNHSAKFGLFYTWFNWKNSYFKSRNLIEASIKADTFKASECTQTIEKTEKIKYQDCDPKVCLTKEQGVEKSGLVTRKQPRFIRVKKGSEAMVRLSGVKFGGIEERVCPAGVFRYEGERIVIEDEKCLLCGACGVKSVREMIEVDLPEAGTGPC